MATVTARRAIADALRAPLQESGWRSRAAGWWTRDLTPEWVAVVVVGTAVSGHAAGHGSAHMYVGARSPALEERLARLFRIRDSYQSRTVVSDLASLMGRVPDWLVTPASAPLVAREMAAKVAEVALPYLESLATDEEAVLRCTYPQRLWSAVDACRHVIVTSESRGADRANDAIYEILEAIGDRTDPAAAETRNYLSLLQEQLASPDPT